MSRKQKCCILGCNAPYSKLFRFPKKKDYRAIWRQIIGPYNPDLYRSSEGNLDVLAQRNVCDRHFEPRFIQDSRRKFDAIPTLFTQEEITSRTPNNAVLKNVDSLPKNNPKNNFNLRNGHHDHTYFKWEVVSELSVLQGLINPTFAPASSPGAKSVGFRRARPSPRLPRPPLRPPPRPPPRLPPPSPPLIEPSTQSELEYLRTGGAALCADDLHDTDLSVEIFCLSGTDSSEDEETHQTEIPKTEEPPPEECPFSWQRSSILVPCDTETDGIIDLVEDTEMFMYDDDGALTRDKGADENAGEANTEDADHHYKCNSCDTLISGPRYTCVQCADYDVCGACDARGAHSLHYVLRVPQHRPHSELQAVLQTIRRVLLSDGVIQLDGTQIKSEVKEEPAADPIGVEPAAGGGGAGGGGARGAAEDASDTEVELQERTDTEVESQARTDIEVESQARTDIEVESQARTDTEVESQAQTDTEEDVTDDDIEEDVTDDDIDEDVTDDDIEEDVTDDDIDEDVTDDVTDDDIDEDVTDDDTDEDVTDNDASWAPHSPPSPPTSPRRPHTRITKLNVQNHDAVMLQVLMPETASVLDQSHATTATKTIKNVEIIENVNLSMLQFGATKRKWIPVGNLDNAKVRVSSPSEVSYVDDARRVVLSRTMRGAGPSDNQTLEHARLVESDGTVLKVTNVVKQARVNVTRLREDQIHSATHKS